MLDMSHDIRPLKGAEYNPRFIDDDSIKTLAESITRLGLIKPLIVRGTTLVAGHQRTRALRSLGVTHAPAYVLDAETTTYDEVRFNQLHNGTDLDAGDEQAVIDGGFTETGYQFVEPGQIRGNMRCSMANVRAEICSLILKYGPWGAVVATKSGRVIHCAQYALAAKATNTRLTCYVIEDEREAEYASFLGRQYGVFSYAKLKKTTYIQTLAQMYRLREGPSERGNKSTLYEHLVIPHLNDHPTAKCIDFGSGQGDYAKSLRRKYVNIDDVELFRRVGGSAAFDLKAINTMIDKMVRGIAAGGYDVVICDSVLNSVDCREAEAAVMQMLNVLAKPGGMVFFSGRKTERIESQYKFSSVVGSSRYVEFMDADGFTALYRKGHWFYQKFHSVEQIKELADRFGFEIVRIATNLQSTSWQAAARKVRDVSLEDAESAAAYEFELPLGEDRSIARSADVIAAIRGKYAKRSD